MKQIEFKHKGCDEAPDSYAYLKLSYGGVKSDNRILFVLDYVPSEDLHNGYMLSGEQGKFLFELIKLAKKRYLIKDEPFTWIACNYNAYRTVGKSEEYVNAANEKFGDRLNKIIAKFKPTCVITFGKAPSMHLNKKDYTNYLGVPVKASVGDHDFVTVNSLSINTVMKQSSGVWLAGYVARNIANAIAHKVQYRISTEHESIFVDTPKKFNTMMKELWDAKVVSIDTETTNLNKVQNTLLTFQAATTSDHGFFLPIAHKDTPFSNEKIATFKNELKEYFETCDAKWMVFANAVFDLNVMRSPRNLGVKFYKSNIWDVFAGEFMIDENMKFLSSYANYYYSLLNITTQYGSNVYQKGKFKKSDRATIVDRDLDEDLIRYGTVDVIAPFNIRLQQIKKAERMGHEAYMRGMEQISDTIHTISKMESTGSGVDIEYLFGLRLPDSPIKQTIAQLKKKLYSLPGVIKAENLIRKSEGVPANAGAWVQNSKVESVFDFGKNKHKQLLYFKVLKLKPLNEGKADKNGVVQGKLDKTFQKAYKDVPEVALFSDYVKAQKLENSFVKSFIKQFGKKPDFQYDKRIRPSYDYLKVITGRISSNDPSLHQIPSRSKLGKNIKRIFIARFGCLYIKVDFRSHEVRGWGNISGDKGIAKVFNDGDAMIAEFKLNPSPELALKIENEADPHKINASYFFELPIEKVTKEIRDSVKNVVFGLIYGMSYDTLAAGQGKPVEYIEDMVKRFFARFPMGAGWFDFIEKTAREALFVQSPLGLRRNLYGYLVPSDVKGARGIHNAMNRRARNSPPQGMSAQLTMTGARLLDKLAYKHGVELYINNSVHDSLENEVGYRDFFRGIKFVEYTLTEGAAKIIKRRHNWEMLSTPKIDMDFGGSLATCEKWDHSLPELVKLLTSTLEFQKNELKYKVNVEKTLDLMFSHIEEAPPWLIQQIKNYKNRDIHKYDEPIGKHLRKLR